MKDYYSGHPDQYYGGISYSQHGEDLIFLNLFDQLGITNPTWLDLGAHHPSRISNTKLLYDRGFHGINVEANNNLIEEFYRQRPRDKNVNCGVSLMSGSAVLFMFDDFSGLNTLSNAEVDYIKATCNMELRGRKIVDVRTLKEIVDTYCDRHFPELLSCDIEGLDYDVLESADFSESSPIIICVEARETKKMCEMMKSKKFFPYCQVGENLIFLRDFYLYTLTKDWPRPEYNLNDE